MDIHKVKAVNTELEDFAKEFTEIHEKIFWGPSPSPPTHFHHHCIQYIYSVASSQGFRQDWLWDAMKAKKNLMQNFVYSPC